MQHGRAGRLLAVLLFSLTALLPIRSFSTEYEDVATDWEPVLRNGTVTHFADGDTIWFRDDEQPEDEHDLVIRMVSMDTPEVWHNSKDIGQDPWGPQAAKALQRMLPMGTRGVLVDFGRDKYGRTLGRVFVGKTDINLKMTRAGWGVPYIYCEGKRCDAGFFAREHAKDYFDACELARREGRGVYDPENPIDELPFEYRLRYTGRKPEKYVGDFYTGDLFAPEDYNEVDLCRRVFFKSRRQAESLGFRMME